MVEWTSARELLKNALAGPIDQSGGGSPCNDFDGSGCTEARSSGPDRLNWERYPGKLLTPDCLQLHSADLQTRSNLLPDVSD